MFKLKRSIPEHRYHLTRVSANKKLGGIPASTTSRSTCPTRCSLYDSGCYGEQGPLALHWRLISEGDRGVSLEEFCEQIAALPKFQLWRHDQAGDLPGDRVYLDAASVNKIVQANRGRHGFTFCHYDPFIPENAEVLQKANEQGFTVNLSAETLDEADAFFALGIAPVVVILPIDQTTTVKTPAGNTVMVCPATVGNTTCAICAICANPDRRFIIGFPAHGSGKAKAQAVFFMAKA